jgi:hypothetical protein
VIADSLRPPLVHTRGGHWQLLLRSPANGAAPGADLEEEGEEHRHRRNKQTDGCVERVLPDLPPAVRVERFVLTKDVRVLYAGYATKAT